LEQKGISENTVDWRNQSAENRLKRKEKYLGDVLSGEVDEENHTDTGVRPLLSASGARSISAVRIGNKALTQSFCCHLCIAPSWFQSPAPLSAPYLLKRAANKSLTGLVFSGCVLRQVRRSIHFYLLSINSWMSGGTETYSRFVVTMPVRACNSGLNCQFI